MLGNRIVNNILGVRPKADKRSRNNTTYKKLIVNEWFKTYHVMDVSEGAYNNSPTIETAGTATGFKIKNNNHLNFLVAELKAKGFKEE